MKGGVIKLLCVFSILLCGMTPLLSQNLVPNPSFEQYETCPSGLGQIYKCDNWFSPNTGTPDYFNYCAAGSVSGVSDNFYGEESAYDGAAYAGIIIYTSQQEPELEIREYLEIELMEALEADKHYLIQFQMSLADMIGNCKSKSIGAHFSVNVISDPSSGLSFDFIPQVQTENNSQTNGWTNFQASFVAEGGEKYMTIGNFNSNQETEEWQACPALENTYLYIDAVSVIEVEPLEYDGATEICEGENISLTALSSGAIQWLDDEKELLSEDKEFSFQPEQDEIIHLSDGIYEIEIPLTVIPSPTIIWEENYSICEGDSITLDAFANNYEFQYLWEIDGSVTSQITIKEAGNYQVVLSANDCEHTFMTQVDLIEESIQIDLAENAVLCNDERLEIDLELAEEVEVFWSDGIEGPERTIEQAGLYTIELKSECEVNTFYLDVQEENCSCTDLLFPTAFSPNGDGLNDQFKAFSSCNVVDFHVQVFSRWGNLLVESSETDWQWDGHVNGERIEAGVYLLQTEYELEIQPGRTERRSDQSTVTILP